MNAPIPQQLLASQVEGPVRLREIPYNYTSFSDREIVLMLVECNDSARGRDVTVLVESNWHFGWRSGTFE